MVDKIKKPITPAEMKILIGTPVNEVKDYSMELWLKNVSDLIHQYPAYLLMVDNSPNPRYVEKIKDYCQKFGITNYKIEHFEIDDRNLNIEQSRSLKVEFAQEMIRRAVLKGSYDAWFSWECDQIIPSDALNKLIELMQSGNYMMVVHNSWARTNSTDFNTNMGVTLISREALKTSWFLPDRNGKISLDISDSYNVDETMFKKRVLKSGGNYIEVYGKIDPIYHLNK
jgi:hypothetical protein